MTITPKRILMIGGSSGIGLQIVNRLIEAGDEVHVACRNAEPLEGLNVTTQRFDALDPDATLSVPESLDGLVYLPGSINLKPFHRLSSSEFMTDMEINYFGAIRALKQALPALKRSNEANASVVLFSSVAATTGMPFHASIGAAKAAVEGLGRALAAEWAPKIRVNVLAPSLTNTPLASSFFSTEDRIASAAKRHPLDRLGSPEETAGLVTFLLSNDAAFMTGQVLNCDGGLSSVRQF